MTVQEVAELVQGKFRSGDAYRERRLEYAFAADLMSDVLTLTSNDVLFITGLCAPQTVRTAVVADIHTILMVRGKSIPSSLAQLAEENEITIIESPFSMYRACGVLLAAGLKPIF